MKAMLLAAGLGTRLRPYTDRMAKPAIPFLNIPLLYYAVGLLDEVGLSELVVNAHHKPEQIQALAERVPGLQAPARVSLEKEAPLGSGGGIWRAKQWLGTEKRFLIANGDEVIIPRNRRVMAELLEAHDREDALSTILVMRHPGVGTQFGGVWADASGRVHGFGKTPPAGDRPLTGFHYIGIQVLSNRVFSYLPEGESNILYDALVAGIRAGEKVRIHEDEFGWFETGNPRDFLEATAHCLNHEMNDPFLRSLFARFWTDFNRRPSLWTGARCRLPEAAVAGALCLAGHDCGVDPGSSLKGFVVLGDGAKIEGSVSLENAIVAPGVTVPAGTRARDTLFL